MKVAELAPQDFAPPQPPIATGAAEHVPQQSRYYNDAPGFNAPIEAVHDFVRAKDPEVERLVAFDRAIGQGDEEGERAAIGILDQAQAASQTNPESSEYQYLVDRWDARSRAQYRRGALDRAVEQGNDAAINNILDQADAARTKDGGQEYDDLMDRLAAHGRSETPLSQEQQRQKRKEAFEQTFTEDKVKAAENQDNILDRALDAAIVTNDYTEYEELRRRQYQDQPGEYGAVAQDSSEAIAALMRNDSDTFDTILGSVRAEAMATGNWHDYKRLRRFARERIDANIKKVDLSSRPATLVTRQEQQQNLNLPRRLLRVVRFLGREALGI